MTISLNNGYGTTYNFEVVNKIPSGYRVWNIPRKGMEGYLPLCLCYSGTHTVMQDSLKAIPMPETDAVILSRAKGLHGIDTPQKALDLAKKAKTPDRTAYFNDVAELLKKYTD